MPTKNGKKTSLLIAALLALTAPVAVAATAPPVQWCQTVTFTGKVRQSIAIHPMNQTRFTVFTLVLKHPVTIVAGLCEGTQLEAVTTDQIQIKQDSTVIGRYKGREVTVSGQLISPENAYDVRPAILYPPITIKMK